MLSCFVFFFLILHHPPISTLFPYTTLFRSWSARYHSWRYAKYAVVAECGTLTRFPGVRRHRDPPRRTNGCRRENPPRSEEHTSELQSRQYLVCRLLLEKKKHKNSHICLDCT